MAHYLAIFCRLWIQFFLCFVENIYRNRIGAYCRCCFANLWRKFSIVLIECLCRSYLLKFGKPFFFNDWYFQAFFSKGHCMCVWRLLDLCFFCSVNSGNLLCCGGIFDRKYRRYFHLYYSILCYPLFVSIFPFLFSY